MTTRNTEVHPPNRTDTDPAAGDLPAQHGDRPDAETIERALRAFEDRYPRAPIIAIGTNGLTLEMPATVPRRENLVLLGRSGLDSIPAEDHERLLHAFDQVLESGTGECLVHPPQYGEVMWYGFDLRERHGVIVALIGIDADPGATAQGAGSRDMVRVGPPRFAAICKDERAFVTSVGDGITEILGWEAEEMVGHRSLEFIHPDDHALAVENWVEMLSQPGPSRRIRQRVRHRDGSWVWFESTNHNFLAEPDRRCVVTEMVDISDEMAAHEALRAREQLLARLAETVPVGLLQIDGEGRVVYTNDRLHQILGLDRAATAQAQLATVVADDRLVVERALDGVLSEGTEADLEVACSSAADGELRFCTVSLRALRHDDGAISGAIGCVADVTDGVRMREELKFRASFDQLTGCHNRASIMAALDAEVASCSATAGLAVMFVDLDGFKSINDRHGHAAGDEVLRSTASLLRERVREKDLVGRTGGDEFLVICPDVASADRAMALAERLAGALHDGMAQSAPMCTASIGVAWSQGGGASADSLVAAADEAMYKAKRTRMGEPKLARFEA